MDVAAWCTESRVWVVAGKGGVGKTTIAAAFARAAADAGLSVLVVELEGKPGLPAAFGQAGGLGYETVLLYERPGGAGEAGPPCSADAVTRGERDRSGVVAGPIPPGSIRARRLTPDDALLEYLSDHGLQRVSKRLVSSGVLDVVATAIPGIRDVLVLGKIKQLERSGIADVVVVDAPATGHAMTFLTSASGLVDAARGGPLRTQAADVVELLRDSARCRILLVTLPEEMPVSETIEAAYQLEDRVGVHLGPIVVNCAEEVPEALTTGTEAAARAAGVSLEPEQLDELEAARQFRVHRLDLAREQTDRLRRELPLPQLLVPRLLTDAVGPNEVALLADALGMAVTGLRSHAGAP